MLDENSIPKPFEPIAPNLIREQELSGLCASRFLVPSVVPLIDPPVGSPMCFVLAAFNYPGAIRSAWGRMAEELDAEAWDLLDGPGTSAVQNDRGLGMLLKMTRCADLGLGEMFFPDEDPAPEDIEEEEAYSEEDDYGIEVELRDAGKLGQAVSSSSIALGHGHGVDLHTPSQEREPSRLVQGVDALSLAA